MVVCLIVSRCYMFECLTDRIDRKTGYVAARKGNSQNRGYHYTNNEARLVKIKATDKTGQPCWYNNNRNSLLPVFDIIIFLKSSAKIALQTFYKTMFHQKCY